MRVLCYYLRKRFGRAPAHPAYYAKSINGVPVISYSSCNRVAYDSLDNALASRRKLYNRYGIDFDVVMYGYDMDPSGHIYNYHYEPAEYGAGFGNPPAYKARRKKD